MFDTFNDFGKKQCRYISAGVEYRRYFDVATEVSISLPEGSQVSATMVPLTYNMTSSWATCIPGAALPGGKGPLVGKKYDLEYWTEDQTFSEDSQWKGMRRHFDALRQLPNSPLRKHFSQNDFCAHFNPNIVLLGENWSANIHRHIRPGSTGLDAMYRWSNFQPGGNGLRYSIEGCKAEEAYMTDFVKGSIDSTFSKVATAVMANNWKIFKESFAEFKVELDDLKPLQQLTADKLSRFVNEKPVLVIWSNTFYNLLKQGIAACFPHCNTLEEQFPDYTIAVIPRHYMSHGDTNEDRRQNVRDGLKMI